MSCAAFFVLATGQLWSKCDCEEKVAVCISALPLDQKTLSHENVALAFNLLLSAKRVESSPAGGPIAVRARLGRERKEEQLGLFI